jgi:hypothetical protein
MIEVTTENSFISMEQADQIFNMVPGCEEWATLDADTKARLLIHASKMLSHLAFGDVAEANTTQWTLVELHKRKFVEATIHQAWFLYKHGETSDQAIADYTEGKTSESIGPISSTKVPGFSYRKMYHPVALKMLDFLLVAAKRIVRA